MMIFQKPQPEAQLRLAAGWSTAMILVAAFALRIREKK
jgi:hypothetical protein